MKFFYAVLVALSVCVVSAFAGSTTILSTTTYNVAAASYSDSSPTALPKVGAYNFDCVATTSGTTNFTGLILRLEQEGISGGGWYTVNASTFSTMAGLGPTVAFVTPDVYLGGRIRAVWSITTGSATVKVVAREVNP